MGLAPPLLTQYYLSALVIGYCSGYLLLIGSVPISKLSRSQKPTPLQRCLAKLTVAAFWIVLAAMPLMLVWRNLEQIRATNSPALRQFAHQLYQSLPAGKSVVLSDNPAQLLLVTAELGARHHDKVPLLLDTQSLAWGQYHIFKAAQFKLRWPVKPPTNGLEVLESGKLLQLISAFSLREQVAYLHPSFGGCFELFADRPNGAVHCLVASNLSCLASRALRAAAVRRGEALDAKCFSLAVENLGRVAALGVASSALFSPPMTPSRCFSAQRRQFQPHA
jgi:hypothetical protein